MTLAEQRDMSISDYLVSHEDIRSTQVKHRFSNTIVVRSERVFDNFKDIGRGVFLATQTGIVDESLVEVGTIWELITGNNQTVLQRRSNKLEASNLEAFPEDVLFSSYYGLLDKEASLKLDAAESADLQSVKVELARRGYELFL